MSLAMTQFGPIIENSLPEHREDALRVTQQLLVSQAVSKYYVILNHCKCLSLTNINNFKSRLGEFLTLLAMNKLNIDLVKIIKTSSTLTTEAQLSKIT